MIIWPDPTDYDVVMVSDDDVPEQADIPFALALVPNAEWLTWYELRLEARAAAIEEAELFEWSVHHESNGCVGR
jgi:hypothetical protein